MINKAPNAWKYSAVAVTEGVYACWSGVFSGMVYADDFMCLVFFRNALASVRNSPRKVTCPEGKQVEKVACPP